MDTNKQMLNSSRNSSKITRNMASKLFERLNASGQVSPSGKAYTMPMIRNWLYDKSYDAQIETMYLKLLVEMDPSDKEDKKAEARMHIEMAEKILSEI